ncbi:MAG: HupE/UreJ family protein, partial [Pseudomonadales bacterium]
MTETEWRLRFRQPQMMGRVLPLVPQSNCGQEERGVTLAVDAVETEYRLHCPEGLTRLAMPGLERTLADAMVTLLPLTGDPQQFSLSPRSPERDLRQGAAVPAYLALGVEHLVFGIDHVCFVLLLVYLYPTLRQLLLIVTSFTLAHSLTLGLASLGVLTLPGGPVEALIALSIVLLATEALGRRGAWTAPALAPWKLCFAFGLLHGL